MDTDAGAETDVSVRKKRPHHAVSAPGTEQTDSDTETETRVTAKYSTSRRGKAARKGRGEGVARARAELKKLEAEAAEVAFERKLRNQAFKKQASQVVLGFEETSTEAHKEDSTNLCAEELRAVAGKNTAIIVELAQKSSNLKGPLAKKLKDAAAALQEVVETLAARNEAEETRSLRADNGRLRKQVESLKAELKAHRREFSEMRTAANESITSSLLDAKIVEELKGSIVSSVGVMLDARFAGIEERLLPVKIHRPPLAADRNNEAQALRAGVRPPVANPASQAELSGFHRKPNTQNVESSSLPVQLAANQTIHAAPVASAPSQRVQDDGWSTVVRRGNKEKRVQAATGIAASSTSPVARMAQVAKPKLTQPRTSAVIVTLQPEAAEKGVTYAQLLERAELGINLQELGIGAGMKVRRAATGARLLELPKEQTAEQADMLAEKLRTVLDGVANVMRPTKCADLRITGLDDSVTTAKVATAVARAGKCSEDAVKVGQIRLGPGGMGMVIARCPITAAKVLSDDGKILVGWSAARVQVLDQLPMRCYKCLGIGHTRALCPSNVDRSRLCFRCGRDGHKASECTGELRCDVCVTAGMPFGHIMGGRFCNPPQTKGKVTNGRIVEAEEHQQVHVEADMSS